MISPSFLEVDRTEISAESPHVVKFRDERLAVFQVGDDYFAINNRCPHAGAALGRGKVDGESVSCPLHRWNFNLRTGECTEDGSQPVATYPVTVTGDTVRVDVTSIVSEPVQRQFLVRYGAMGWVARFEHADLKELGHRQQVVLQTSRGQELGEVLSGPEPMSDSATNQPAGRIVRLADADDLSREQLAPSEFDFESCRATVGEHSQKLDLIDFERLFDGETIVLYYVGEDTDVLPPLAQQLNEASTHRVVLQSAIEDLAPVTGDEGGGGGGCGSGGCGSGGCSS